MKTYKAYICGTAEMELGLTEVRVYPSIKSLEQNEKCTKECGIKEISIAGIATIKKGKPSKRELTFNQIKNKLVKETKTKIKNLEKYLKRLES